MFGKRLKIKRQSLNLTQQKVANLLNITLNAYQKYESGHREPNHQMLILIADTLDVSVDWLLGRDDYLKSLGVSFDELQ